MKTILTVLLVCFSFSMFAQKQSKREVNKELKKHVELAKKANDTLKSDLARTLNAQGAVEREISPINQNVLREREEIDDLCAGIHRIKGEMYNSGYNPNQYVSENELAELCSVGNLNYEVECLRLISPTAKVDPIEDLGDISKEKIKEQNHLLFLKISEYNNSSGKIQIDLAQQKKILEEMEYLETLAEKELVNCTATKNVLNQKYRFLDETQMELAAKAEEERKKRLAEEAKRAKNTKSSKVRFVPPVIVEEEPPVVEEIGFTVFDPTYPAGDSEFWIGDDVAPPPPPAEYNSKEVEIYTIVEESAEFPGGYEAFQKYLSTNLKYPEAAKEKGIQGKVYLKFVVSKTGEISNVKVQRGIADCVECDNEAVRVVSSMPNWKPGKNAGKAVDSYFTIPIVFKLVDK